MKRKIFIIVIGVSALVFCTGTLMIMSKAQKLGTIYLKTSGSPQEVLHTFYQSIEEGNLDAAYACLAEYKDLGLGEIDAMEEHQMIIESLKQSYQGEVIGEVVQNGLDAKGQVQFRYLDIATLKESVEQGITPVLTYYVDTLSRAEIYDKDGEYLPSFLEMVYDEVLFDVLHSDTEIYKEKIYEVHLTYMEDGWKILWNQEMLNCFLGGKNT